MASSLWENILWLDSHALTLLHDGTNSASQINIGGINNRKDIYKRKEGGGGGGKKAVSTDLPYTVSVKGNALRNT